MANNSFLPVVAGPAVANSVESFANEDIAGVKYPALKNYWGAAGVATPVSAANPMPVAQQGNVTIGSMPAITGTVTATISGTPAVTQSGAWTVGITGTVTVAGTVAVSSLPAITIAASQGVQITGSLPPGSANIGKVDINSMPAITGSVGITGTPAVTISGTPTFLMDPTQLGPDVPHGSSDTVTGSNPTKVGGQARLTNPAAVTDAQRTNFIADKLGKQVVVAAIREKKGMTYTQIATTTETTIVAAGGAGVFRDIYGLTFANTSSVVQAMTLRNGAGTVLMVWQLPPTDTRGITLDCGSAMPAPVANSTWTATISPLASGSVHITALWVDNL